MIMSEEKVMEALKICASHDKSRCVECPYNRWCGDFATPHMNMQKDALEIITRQKNLLYAADLAFREIYKQLGKANLDLEIILAEGEDMKNTYSVIECNPEKLEGINTEGAKALIEWLTGDDASALIAKYGEEQYGEALFYLIEK